MAENKKQSEIMKNLNKILKIRMLINAKMAKSLHSFVSSSMPALQLKKKQNKSG
jgi:hypothetical protein